MTNLPDSLQAARVRCAQQRPYLSSLLFRLHPVAKPGLKTMAVDKYGRLYFDPEDTWTVSQAATVMYHECSHLLRDHCGRAENLGIRPENAVAWNICADIEINDDIEAEGGTDWPFPPCLPKNFKEKDGDFAEEYYARLPKVTMKVSGVGAGQCGGAAGNPGEHEDGAPGKESPGLNPAEVDAIRHKVASDIREHARGRGSVPGHWQEWASSILEPKLNWRKILRGAIKHTMADIAGMVNYTYARPSRRQHSVPRVVLPSLRQPVPNIAVVVDTSGSMSNDDIATVLGEVNGVLKQCGASGGVDAIVCDAAVHGAKRVFKAEQIVIAGRGGTDLTVGIEAAMARPIRPHVIIVLTDGDTPWPESPTSARVIAAIVGARAEHIEVPYWIKKVAINEP